MGRFATIAAAGSLLVSASAFPSIPWRREENNVTAPGNTTEPAEPTPQLKGVWDFAEIPVSPELNWVECFDKYTCTNLEVPLDYANESAGTTNIAFIKLQGGDGSGPDILFNPGGPGGSGISSLQGSGDGILAAAGGNYNVVAFDPRGVNNSGPSLTCFPGAPEARAQYGLYRSSLFTIPLSERFQLAKAEGERCSAVNEGTDAKYVGTSAVVQDMKHFIELQATTNDQSAEEAKLWYYGVSYGTVIGQTFAAMYPDKVERMVLDGNVYAEGHYNGDVSSSLTNSDAAVRSFFTYCAEAGPDKCEFAGNSSTAGELEERYRDILQKLEDEPLVVSSVELPFPRVITRASVESIGFSKVYGPATGFPEIAKALVALEKGDASGMLGGATETEPVPQEVPNPNYQVGEATSLVTCVDVNTRWNLTSIEQYKELVDDFKLISYYAGEQMGRLNAVSCVGYTIYPPESQTFPGFSGKTTTATPILFINNSRDPVTPVSSAYKVSRYFEGSVVLEQDSTGHGMSSAPSACTNGHFAAYLADGTLPAENTICEGDSKPLVDTLGPEEAAVAKLRARSIF